jgi:hypothetical protein
VRRIPYGRNLGFLDRTSLEHSHEALHIEFNTTGLIISSSSYPVPVSLLPLCLLYYMFPTLNFMTGHFVRDSSRKGGGFSILGYPTFGVPESWREFNG